ncbi:DUF805 domain-containing protein [Levilactobacillus brevis]|uniref:DUF805 domain-containing protein n=1 Tax=Levilactobacillus brevis TaxID=1580 RepID=UPI000A20184E|nr:DUF805 domain-containing protein [Levilactobacillus brevis]ARN94083.1 hypothetical protein AZI11_14305 [Levilactobacillus brevis]MBS1014078.1 DUF805 domain-containing protein [Levilactobacillus brevis]
MKYYENWKKYYADFWTRLFDFNGTSTRPAYWWVEITNTIIYAIIIVLISLITKTQISDILSMNTNNNLAFVLFCIITIVYGVFILALTTRRLHDTNNSGWWIVGTFVPFHIGDIIGVYVLILTLLPSRKSKWRQP